ncbi:hypothetical protein S4A8_13585 [Salinisphaera sp. S4-8]|uniref:hypothetical protein n=1 Tax=Salinisphaera sp. S4-8 TaxID=633357 RepID=UPI0033413AD2
MIQSAGSNGRGQQGPPDLAELFNRVSSGVSGVPFGSKGIIGVAILALMIWGALSAFYTVQPE